MKQIIKMLPFFLVACVVFYGCPWIVRGRGKDLMLVIFVTPFLCFAIGMVYSYWYGLNKLFPVVIKCLCFPVVSLYYTATAISYPIFFGLSVLAGEVEGTLLKELRAHIN